ncbi:MAG: hypothetical protein V1647_06000 [Pseudomonadota bacterium]
MKKLLIATLCFLVGLSLYSQEKKTPFWGLLSFNNNGQVVTYKGAKTISAAVFISDVLSGGYCFAGDEGQAYSDLSQNRNSYVLKNKISWKGDPKVSTYPGNTDLYENAEVPTEETYGIYVDDTKKIYIKLEKERTCVNYVQERIDWEDGARQIGIYSCREWEETTCDQIIPIKVCEKWEAPLQEYLMNQ